MRYAIIVAAGNSVRYGGDVNKLDELLFGKTVLSHSIDIFKAVADTVVVVGRRIEGTVYAEGGATRFLSVLDGLDRLPDDGVVAIHDGARPFITESFVRSLYKQAERFGSAVPSLAVTDTLYRKGSNVVSKREDFITVQTPQIFDTLLLKSAYHAATSSSFTDDSSVFAANGNEVHFAEGLRANVKLTYRGDLPDFRVGNGFDVHPFTEGNGVVLGGVKIPFDKKLQGHSDADALCHAVCDAILSASGNRDIGHQFPDTDPRYEGIDSTLLLGRCVELANKQGLEVVNISATVICQAPRIAPYIDAMAARIASVCGVTPNCVNISATTTEHLGALGNGDGVAAQAVALLRSFG